MTGWAGFWIGCGIIVLGLGVAHIGDSIQMAARILAEAYQNTFTDDNEEPKDV